MAKIDPVVDIDINNLFYQLHETALKTAKAAVKDIDVVNLGVDYKNQSFVGAGDFLIVAQQEKNNNSNRPTAEPDKFKQDCKDAITAYVKVFAGTNNAKELSNDDSAFQPINQQVAPTGESIACFSLPQLLMEDVPSNSNENKRSCIGYYIEYTIDIEGQKKHRWYDLMTNFGKYLSKSIFNGIKSAAKTVASGLFGGMFKDLQSLKMNIGGKEYNLGAPIAKSLKDVATGIKNAVTIAGQKFIKVFGKTDLEELNNNFSKALHDEFPNSHATPHLYNVDSLLTKLRKQKKLDADIQRKLLKNGKILRMEHLIGLQVSKAEENYEQYSIDSLYRCFVDALNETKSLSSLKGMPDLLQRLTSTFSEDDIIKIDGYKTTLGINKVKRRAVTADSLNIKYQFMKTFAGSLVQLNEDMYEDEMADKIKEFLRDDTGKKQFSDSKLKELAYEFSIMDPSKEYDEYRTPQYPKPTDIENKLHSVSTEKELDDIIDAFKNKGNIKKLYLFAKRLFGEDSSISKNSIDYDLYLFCLANVLRQKDEDSKKMKRD